MIKECQEIIAQSERLQDHQWGLVIWSATHQPGPEDGASDEELRGMLGYLAGVAETMECALENMDEAGRAILVESLRGHPSGRAVLKVLEIEEEPCSQPN